MALKLDPRNYYRLPWSLTDNAISWLEVTANCNLDCKGCYRDRHSTGHKTLAEVADDLAVFARERKSDCMSIAGGDPLVHPEIVEIVRMVKKGGWKPIINTNGLALTPALLHDLKKAGAYGFTFHIDTSQGRKDSPRAEHEQDHNHLRERFAKMLAAEGGLSCSFNQTVTRNTLGHLPEVIRWAQKNSDIVHTMVFILYREPRMLGPFDLYANGKKVSLDNTYEETDWGVSSSLKAQDVVDVMTKVDPLYHPAAYLGGNVDPNSFKWLLAMRMGNGNQTYGYVSPKFMEVIQNGYHMLRNRWISYSSPASLKAGRATMFGLAPFDSTMRKAAGNYLKSVLRNPLNLFKRAHMQAFMVIQPIDFLEDGRQNMCDGCPDMTVHKGKMYWSCRLEEIKKYGCFCVAVPKAQQATAQEGRIEEPKTNRPTLQA